MYSGADRAPGPKSCKRAFVNLLAGLTAEDTAKREKAWALFSAMVPALRAAKACPASKRPPSPTCAAVQA